MARKRPLTSSGTLVVLEHTSKVLAGNPLGDPHVRKLGVWLPPQYDRAGPGGRRRTAIPCSTTSWASPARALRTSTGSRSGKTSRARGAAHPREEDGTGDPRLSRLLHLPRRQPIHQFVGGRPLRRLPDARDHPFRRPRIPHARLARAPGLLRQVLRRLWRDHPRDEVCRSTGAPSPITRATPTSTSSTGTTGRTR